MSALDDLILEAQRVQRIPANEPLQLEFDDEDDLMARVTGSSFDKLAGHGWGSEFLIRGLGEAAYQVSNLATTGAGAITNIIDDAVEYALTGKPSSLTIDDVFAPTELRKWIDQKHDELDRAFENSSMAEFGAFLGEWIPVFLGGAKAVSKFTQGFMKSAPKAMATLGERRMANLFIPATAAALTKAGVELPKSMAKQAAGMQIGMPYYERMLQATGNAMGWGGVEVVRETANTGDLEYALKVGAAVGIGGLALEGMGVAAFRKLFPRSSKVVDIAKAEASWDKVAPGLLKSAIAGTASEATGIGQAAQGWLPKGEEALQALAKVGGIDLVPGYVEAIESLGVSERTWMLKRLMKYYKDFDLDGMAKDMGVMDPELRKIIADQGKETIAHRTAKATLGARKEKWLEAKAGILKAEEAAKVAYGGVDTLEKILARTPAARRVWDDTPSSGEVWLAEARDYGEHLSRLVGMQANAKRAGYNLGGGPLQAKTRARQAVNAVNQSYLSVHNNKLEMWRLKYLSSPEGIAKDGMTSLKFLEANESMDVGVRMLTAKGWNEVDKATKIINKDMKAFNSWSGLTKKQIKNNEHILEIVDTYERGQMPAVRGVYSKTVADAFERGFVGPVEFFGPELKKVGVKNAMLTETEAQMLGTPGHFPHVTRRDPDFKKSEKLMRDSLRQTGDMTETEIESYLAGASWRQNSVQRFGTVDWQRQLPGTLKEKLNGTYGKNKKQTLGLPFESDPVKAIKQHIHSSATRLEMAKIAGPNGELGPTWKALMTEEGVSENVAAWLVNSTLTNQMNDQFMARWARNIAAAEVFTKLTFVPLANAFQLNMTATRFGPLETLKAVPKTARDLASNWRILSKEFAETVATTDKSTIAQVLGTLEGSFLSSNTIFKGLHPNTMMEKVAQIELSAIGFNIQERLWRMTSAHAALGHSRKMVEGIANGSLKGKNYTMAQRSLASLGVNVDDILARYKATGRLGFNKTELDLIATGGIKQTQFTTGKLDVPPWARTPHGKLVCQFKSFAFNAGKQTRDQILREFYMGNYKPLGYWLALGGMSGEMISLAKDKINQRPHIMPNGIARLVHDLSYQGGIGVAMNAASAAFYGRSAEFLAGPAASDILGVSTGLARTGARLATGEPKPLEPILMFLRKQPISQGIGAAYRAGLALGGAGADAFTTGWDFTPEEQLAQKMGVGVDELRKQMKEMEYK